jgi:hypothetical protein
MSEWWEAESPERLSQGDVLQDLVSAILPAPLTPIKQTALKGGKTGWQDLPHWQPDQNGIGWCAAKGRLAWALVLSHSCELDKARRRGRVLVAPVLEITQLVASQREQVMDGTRFALLPLPDIPSVGDCFADLRSSCTIDRALAEQSSRIAHATPEMLPRIQRHLIAFLVRDDLRRQSSA